MKRQKLESAHAGSEEKSVRASEEKSSRVDVGEEKKSRINLVDIPLAIRTNILKSFLLDNLSAFSTISRDEAKEVKLLKKYCERNLGEKYKCDYKNKKEASNKCQYFCHRHLIENIQEALNYLKKESSFYDIFIPFDNISGLLIKLEFEIPNIDSENDIYQSDIWEQMKKLKSKQ